MYYLKKKTDKTSLIQLFTFYKPAYLQKKNRDRLQSIRVFSADGHHLHNRAFGREFFFFKLAL